MANKFTVSYYGNDFKKIRIFLEVIARKLPIEWEFVHDGRPLDIIGNKLVITDITIYDVSHIDDNDCLRLFEFLLSVRPFSKSRVFANISGNKFAEDYCARNHEVPFEIPYDEGSDYLFWVVMIQRLFSL